MARGERRGRRVVEVAAVLRLAVRRRPGPREFHSCERQGGSGPDAALDAR